MKYLKRKENNLKYHEFEQFKGRREQLEIMLVMTTCTITEISDFIFDDNGERKGYGRDPKAFSVTYSAIDGDHKFTVVEGDYISNRNNFEVIRKHEFEKEYVPSKYHMLREELFKELDRLKEEEQYLENHIDIHVEKKLDFSYLRRRLDSVQEVRDIYKKSILKVRTLNIDLDE